MKPSHTLRNLLLIAGLVAGPVDAAVITGNLGGLLTPTGAATNGNLDRQYSHTFTGTGDALGAIITFTYTLSTSDGNLSQAFGSDNLFRYAPETNVNENQNFTITIDVISINSGWTLNSVAKTDTVTVASEVGKTTRFSVNGGSPFVFVPATGTVGQNAQRDFTDSRFTAFNSVGSTLSFLNVDQTAIQGQNLRNLGFSFEVAVIPEPSAALLGGLGMLALLRRRR